MLRIISGKYRSRKLTVPEGLGVRPTTDRMRERIFSMLNHHRYPDLYQARVADLFAGTGALGLEALSRGAAHTTFIEMNAKHVANLKANIQILQAEDETTVKKGNASALNPALVPYDIIFMDPPYHKGLVDTALDSLFKNNWIGDQTVIIAEMGSDENPILPDGFEIVDERIQGKQKIAFIKR